MDYDIDSVHNTCAFRNRCIHLAEENQKLLAEVRRLEGVIGDQAEAIRSANLALLRIMDDMRSMRRSKNEMLSAINRVWRDEFLYKGKPLEFDLADMKAAVEHL